MYSNICISRTFQKTYAYTYWRETLSLRGTCTENDYLSNIDDVFFKFWNCIVTFQVCGKAFNSRDNRNAHRFIHSDKKPYECLVCGMGFMRKPLLYAHMQTQVS